MTNKSITRISVNRKPFLDFLVPFLAVVAWACIVAVGAEGLAAKGTETVTRNGTCSGGKFSKIAITVPISDYFPYLLICHDESTSTTLYCKQILEGFKLNKSELVSRPSFKEGVFYPDISADTCYKQAEQNVTIGQILNNQTLANIYIQPKKDEFLSRGHFCANSDGVYAAEKNATFYYVNACPQWQCINDGNWRLLEMAVRNYSMGQNTNLTLYTGSWGVTTLRDSNQNYQSIYLGKYYNGTRCNKLPIPSCLYKIVLDKSAGTGIVLVMYNNPYSENHNSQDMICQDKCSLTHLVTWNTSDPYRGSTYCCDVAEFCQKMPGYLPDDLLPGGDTDPNTFALLASKISPK